MTQFIRVTKTSIPQPITLSIKINYLEDTNITTK